MRPRRAAGSPAAGLKSGPSLHAAPPSLRDGRGGATGGGLSAAPGFGMGLYGCEPGITNLHDGARDRCALTRSAVGVGRQVARVVSGADRARGAHEALIERLSPLLAREIERVVVNGR